MSEEVSEKEQELLRNIRLGKLVATSPKAFTPAPMVLPVVKVERTSAGLREALFDAMDGLLTGKVDAEQASALAKVSKEICSTVRLEMDALKLKATSPGELKPLKLTSRSNDVDAKA